MSDFHCPDCCPNKKPKPAHRKVTIYLLETAVPVIVTAVTVIALKWLGI